MRYISCLFVLFLVPGWAWSMSPYKRSLTEKKGAFLNNGVFTGGQVGGKGSSLLALRRTYSAKLGMERVVLELGDDQGKPRGEGYFQASIDGKNQRIVVDLAQLKMSKLSEQQVRQMFKASHFVKSVEFTQDPEDQTGTLVLNLNRPARLEVFRLIKKNMPARMVLDIQPLSRTKG